MSDSRPNILLIMTDQQRGDALGIEGHPVLQTPWMDRIATEGVRFRHAYSACPVCIPARRTLMTGQRPRSHGVLMNYNTHLRGPTLPGELARAGYQTHLCGKLHLWPARKLHGFCSADWADAPRAHPAVSDYDRFLRREGVNIPGGGMSHGVHINGWTARPFHLDERLHFTNWITDCAMEFLERRDPTMPYFLKVSYLAPHQPCTPPQCYWDRYMAMDLPDPYVGDWARVFDGPRLGLAVDSWRTCIDPQLMRQFRAGYYGSINHIDDQIGRLLTAVGHNTIVVFTADHGEMLGDHQWIRKRSPYEPSARIPMLMRFPKAMGLKQHVVRDEPVELMDVMPTLLEAAGVDVPASVDGQSVLGLLRGGSDWREYVHGECSSIPSLDSGMQYVTDGRRKYVWLPGRGQEQFFDLEADPREMVDLAGDRSRADEIALWRQRLIDELRDRPEGFTDGRSLRRLAGPTPSCFAEYENSLPGVI